MKEFRCQTVLAFLLAIGTLWRGLTLLAHALGNWGMLAFRDGLLAETSRPDISQQPRAYVLFDTLPRAEWIRSKGGHCTGVAV